MNIKHLIAIGGLAASALFATSATAQAHDGEDHTADPATLELTPAQRNLIRDATKKFRDVDAAIAAGFLPTDTCVALPGVGGMGYHYVNPANIADGVIDATRPEMLVYHVDQSGHLRLGAVEYFAVDADQNPGTDGDRPSLLGIPFDGPMPGHEPGMPVHYDLHAWVYGHNSLGDLAPFNPSVTCP